MLGHIVGTMLFDRCQSSNDTNALCPERTADKRILGGRHNFSTPDNRRYRIPIAYAFCEDSHIRIHAVLQMCTSGIEPKAGRDFVKNQNRVSGICDLTYLLQEASLGLVIPDGLHHHRGQPVRLRDSFEFLNVVVTKRKRRAAQTARNSNGVSAWKQVSIQRVILS